MTTHFFVFQKHSIFMPLRSFYPEAVLLTEQRSDVHPFACFTHPKPSNAVLIEPVIRRAQYVFTTLLPKVQKEKKSLYVLYVYYKWPNFPNSIQAAVLHSDFRDPRVMILNPSAFKKFQKEGVVYAWDPPVDFTCIGSSNEVLL